MSIVLKFPATQGERLMARAVLVDSAKPRANILQSQIEETISTQNALAAQTARSLGATALKAVGDKNVERPVNFDPTAFQFKKEKRAGLTVYVPLNQKTMDLVIQTLAFKHKVNYEYVKKHMTTRTLTHKELQNYVLNHFDIELYGG